MAIGKPVFADIRTQKRLDHFTLRTQARVDIPWLLYCIVYNLAKITNFGPALQTLRMRSEWNVVPPLSVVLKQTISMIAAPSSNYILLQSRYGNQYIKYSYYMSTENLPGKLSVDY
jgi:hypothetical protein